MLLLLVKAQPVEHRWLPLPSLDCDLKVEVDIISPREYSGKLRTHPRNDGTDDQKCII